MLILDKAQIKFSNHHGRLPQTCYILNNEKQKQTLLCGFYHPGVIFIPQMN